jgi:hypothetical protein
MGTSALGNLGLVLENLSSPGLQLLYSGAVSASFSLTTQPGGSTGMRLFVVVQGNTTSGTVSLAGLGVGGGSLNETTPTIAIQGAGQAVQVNDFEYVSVNVYASINTGGVTTTGLANARISIYGIQGSKFLIPSIADIEEDYSYFSPKEARGLLDQDTQSLQLVKKVAISKVDQSLYPEDSLFIGYMGISSSPVVTTIPASPTSLKASAAVSGGPFSLTTQPSPPGMVLQFVVTGASATGTIVITGGTNQFGVTVSETINANGINGNGTYYSSNIYSAINGAIISFTGLTSGSCAINGIYAWQYAFTPDNNALYSAALSWFTGTDSLMVPWGFLTDIEVAFGVEKETTVSLKGGAQDFLPIGNRSTNPLSSQQTTVLGQPTDVPMIGWDTAVFIDAISGTPQTTAYSSVTDGKITMKVPQKPIYTATQSQDFQRLYRQQRSAEMELTIDFVSLDQYEAFRQNLKQYLAVQFFGAYVGAISGTLYSKSWAFIFPARYIKFKRDATKLENVTAQITAKALYDGNAGYSHKLIVTNQMPPTYTA